MNFEDCFLKVNWKNLDDAYGCAIDLQEMLFQLRRDFNEETLTQIMGRVCHQNTRYSSSAPTARLLMYMALENLDFYPILSTCVNSIALSDPEGAYPNLYVFQNIKTPPRFLVKSAVTYEIAVDCFNIGRFLGTKSLDLINIEISQEIRKSAINVCFWYYACDQYYQKLINEGFRGEASDAETVYRLLAAGLGNNYTLETNNPKPQEINDLMLLLGIKKDMGEKVDEPLNRSYDFITKQHDFEWFDGSFYRPLMLINKKNKDYFIFICNYFIEALKDDFWRFFDFKSAFIFILQAKKIEKHFLPTIKKKVEKTKFSQENISDSIEILQAIELYNK